LLSIISLAFCPAAPKKVSGAQPTINFFSFAKFYYN